MDIRNNRQKVLIVDDSPDNIQVLMECLCDEYATVVATDGQSALDMAGSNQPPDIILLDIRMPGMDGYEVCDHLKNDPHLRDIPVIFLSVLESADVKVKAFKSGGVDYIAKPFQVEEVRARVKTHLMIRNLRRSLEVQNQALEQTVAERTRELEIAYGQLSVLGRIKSDFLRMISHEIRTPLNGIMGISELIFELCPGSSQKDEYLRYYLESQERIEKLLEDSLLLNTLESSPGNISFVPAHFTRVLDDAVKAAKDISVSVDLATELSGAVVYCNLELLKRALVILVKLAACFNITSNRITLSAFLKGDAIIIEIPLNFFILSEAETGEFFDLSSNIRGQSHAQKLGLTPVVAERIITLFGGSVSLVKGAGKNGVLHMGLSATGLHDPARF